MAETRFSTFHRRQSGCVPYKINLLFSYHKCYNGAFLTADTLLVPYISNFTFLCPTIFSKYSKIYRDLHIIVREKKNKKNNKKRPSGGQKAIFRFNIKCLYSTGLGMCPRKLCKVFCFFFRVNASNSNTSHLR